MDAKVMPPQVDDVMHLSLAALDIGYFSVKGVSGRNSNGSMKSFAFPSQCARSHGPVSVSLGMAAHSGVNVRVGSTMYFVGKDAALNSLARQTRTINESFVESDDYHALYLGGLHFIVKDNSNSLKSNKVHIRRLIVGLPLNTLDQYTTKVRMLLEGKHFIPGVISDKEIEVTVQSVAVVPQPQGAMVNIGTMRSTEELKEYFAQNILVLDIGGGTFDWFLTNERKAIRARSDAIQKGMLTCVHEICDSIKKGIKDDPMVIKRIDDALQSGKDKVLIGGNKYEMSSFERQIETVMNDCLNAMHNSVLSIDSVDVMIFTGGGAKFLYSQAKKRWPDLEKIMVLDENPIFSNVHGFYVLGEVSNAQTK